MKISKFIGRALLATSIMMFVGCTDDDENNAPVAMADAYTVDEDTTTSFVVLNNDMDADEDTLSIASVASPSDGGTAVINGTSIDYTPANNFNGTETFTYKANDGTEDSDSVTVTVTVTAVNDSPVASAGDDIVVLEGDMVDLNGSSSDEDGDTVAYSWTFVSKPAGSRTMIEDANTSMPKFTADRGGQYELQLKVNDGNKTSTDAVLVRARMFRKTIESLDEDNNNTADRNTTYKYDTNGDLIEELLDSDADGTHESNTTYTYDSSANHTRTDIDEDGNGTIDHVTKYKHDENGSTIETLVDKDNDGTDDSNTTVTYTYEYGKARSLVTLTKGTDRWGRPVDSKQWFTYDDNGSRLTYSYDSDGNESKLERSATYENIYHPDGNQTINFLFDINGDTRPDRNATFMFNANGDLVTKKCDRGNNGTIDMNCRATFDDNGNETKWYCDTNEDGEIDFKFDMEYDVNNNLTKETRWSETASPRRPNYTNTYMYDEDNNRIKKNYDKNSDGSTDSVTTYDWIEIPTE